MKPQILAAFPLCAVIVLTTLACSPNHRQFSVDDNTQFDGNLRGSRAVYYALRATKGNNATDALNPEVVFHWKQVKYKIADITPADVLTMGGEVIVPDYLPLPHKVQHGYLGFGPQNRHGGVEFAFDDGRITDFCARWHREVECPFTLSSVDGNRFQFPATEDVLVKAFGEPQQTTDSFVH